MDKFTIIIPVYNVEEYLRECIDSLLYQTYDNLEIILVNDGSKDESLKICNNYKNIDTRVRVINKHNGGLSSARNKGLENASGEYILFLDADDFLYDNNVIKTFVNIFKSTNVDLIYGTYHSFLEKKNIKDRTFNIGRQINIENNDLIGMNSEETLLKIFKTKSYISSATTKIYKRKLLEENKMKFILNKYHEDEEWTPRVILNSEKIYIYKQKFYLRRYRKDSIMTNKDEKQIMKRIKDILFIANKMIEYTNYNVENIKLKDILNEYFGTFIITTLIMYDELDKKDNKVTIKSDIKQNISLFDNFRKTKYIIIKKLYIFPGVGITSKLLYFLKNKV